MSAVRFHIGFKTETSAMILQQCENISGTKQAALALWCIDHEEDQPLNLIFCVQ